MAWLTPLRLAAAAAFVGLASLAPSRAHASVAAAATSPFDQWSQFVAEASARFGIPVEWIQRVMRAESGGRTHLAGRPITSHAGAMGLMQLMPGTWREMRAAYGLGHDPHKPRDNILAGTAYLRLMYDRFGYPGLFGAYNAGPARYAAHLRGRGLPAETVSYMAAVTGTAAPRLAPAARAVPASPAPLFATLSPSAPPAPAEAMLPTRSASEALFVPLRGSDRSAPEGAP